MKKLYVKSIRYLYENRVADRELKIILNNGTVIRACACHESWEQWGGNKEELYISMGVVQNHNDWLHGGDRP